MYPPSMFGEMALIDGSRRSATALANSTVKTLSLKKKDFERLIENHPSVAITILRRIARIISMRLRRTNIFYVDAIKKIGLI